MTRSHTTRGGSRCFVVNCLGVPARSTWVGVALLPSTPPHRRQRYSPGSTVMMHPRGPSCLRTRRHCGLRILPSWASTGSIATPSARLSGHLTPQSRLGTLLLSTPSRVVARGTPVMPRSPCTRASTTRWFVSTRAPRTRTQFTPPRLVLFFGESRDRPSSLSSHLQARALLPPQLP